VNTTKRVGSIAGEDCTSDCAGQDDGNGWKKRKLIDAEELEMTLPIGRDKDAHERAQQKATCEQHPRSPSIGGPGRVIVHRRRIAVIRGIAGADADKKTDHRRRIPFRTLARRLTKSAHDMAD
jgi:hypothetical protein